MKKVIRYGVGAALAGALTLGPAWAQQSSDPTGRPGSSTGAGSPDSVGKGDTGRTSDRAGGGKSSSDRSSGVTGSTGSSGAGASSAGQKIDKKLQDRLEKIHAGNQAELQLAQLGAQSAQSPEVKQFAQQMQTDHQQLDQQLTQQAQTMGVTLEGKTFQKESKTAQDEMKKMQSKTGQEFDKAFMDRMVKDHEKNLKEVKDGAKDAEKGKHTELASTLQTAQTTIQQHLDHAKQLQKSAGGSASGSRGSSTMGTGSANQSTHDPSAQPKGGSETKSGSRGDTGGPTPGGQDRGTGSGSTVTPGGGEKGTSSDSGTK